MLDVYERKQQEEQTHATLVRLNSDLMAIEASLPYAREAVDQARQESDQAALVVMKEVAQRESSLMDYTYQSRARATWEQAKERQQKATVRLTELEKRRDNLKIGISQLQQRLEQLEGQL